MNVNNRKLFANRDARRRLSEMGGIVASMPELLGVAQQYNQGGTIQPVYNTGVTPFDVIAQRVPGMSQREMIEAGLPRAGLMRREIVEMMRDPSVGGGGVDLNIGPEEFAAMSREERRAAGFSGLGSLNNAYFAARDRLLESQFPMQGPPMPPEPERQLAPEEYINPADEFAGLTSGMTDPYQLPEVVFEQEPAPRAAPRRVLAPEEYINPVDEFPDTTEPIQPRTPDADTRRPVLRPDRPAPAEAEPEAGDASGTDGESPNQGLIRATQEAMDNEDEDPSGAAAKAALTRLLGDADTTVSGRVRQYEQLFQEMFGESDEDKTRERYMNLAMIGFAIASGEDPSALRNIATGLLQGTAQMREDASARRQREDRVKELAVAAGLEDERLAAQLAESLSRPRGGSDDDFMEGLLSNAYQVALRAALDPDNPPTDLREGESANEYAIRVMRQLAGADTSTSRNAPASTSGNAPASTGAPSGMTDQELYLYEGL